MGLNQQGQMFYDSTAANNQKNLLVSLPAASYLTRCVLKGILSVPAAQNSLTTGQTFSHQYIGGVQYGAAGYGGIALTSGNNGGANYLTFGDQVPGDLRYFPLAGTSPIAAVELGNVVIDLDWRGMFRCAAATDFYYVIGCNPGQTVNFITNFAFYAEWAT